MEIAIICFMVMVGLLVVLSIITSILDLIKSIKGKKETKEEPKVSEEPQVEEPVITEVEPLEVNEEPIEEVEVQEISEPDPNEIKFINGAKTLDQKYTELSPKDRGFYDSICNYAAKKEGVKLYKNDKHEIYKVGNTKLITLKIKRDVIIAEFVIVDQEFKDYVTDTKVKVKQTPTIVKVVDEEAVSFAKGSIDLIYNTIPAQVIRRQTNRKSK